MEHSKWLARKTDYYRITVWRTWLNRKLNEPNEKHLSVSVDNWRSFNFRCERRKVFRSHEFEALFFSLAIAATHGRCFFPCSFVRSSFPSPSPSFSHDIFRLMTYIDVQCDRARIGCIDYITTMYGWNGENCEQRSPSTRFQFVFHIRRSIHS